jgi:hypothetical protein
MTNSLDKAERRQLRWLKVIHDNPLVAGMWDGDVCDRLVELGYAQRHEQGGIMLVTITNAGLEAIDDGVW